MLAIKERPMKYMLMLYADEKAGSEFPPEEMAKAMQILGAYQAALTKAGAFVATSALAPTWDAKTVRVEGGEMREDGTFTQVGGEMKVFDGPYAETREQFGGYFIIDVASMDEAIKWATRCPAAQWGSIEVRPYAAGFN
jgi:hypothetical protein